ncbi:MAG: DUF167 domain-containing protein [Chloroflexota bacterium]
MADTKIAVWVAPNSQRNEITGFQEGFLRVRIAAPAEKGRANEELVDFLARSLSIPKRNVTLLSGATARRKVVRISGLDREEAIHRLSIAKRQP